MTEQVTRTQNHYEYGKVKYSLSKYFFLRSRSTLEVFHGEKGLNKPTFVSLKGKTVLITGASAGIGRTSSLAFAKKGSKIIAVARRQDELERLQKEITGSGGQCAIYAVDLTDESAVDTLIADVVREHKTPDIVINNAGRSIRRSVADATDRYHDYERTMAINYFPVVKLTLGFLPGMIERRSGHFINISTWGVPISSVPKFSAYIGSKAAVAAFGRSVDLDTRKYGVTVTNVYPPLVRTNMTAPTSEYRNAPMLTTDQVTKWLLFAARRRPLEIVPRASRVARILGGVHPVLADKFIKLVMPSEQPG